ncbi:MAG TPA: Rrf2 family transcriptional regulator [Desulfobacteraceae bacterium]|nr:Rrf2 family transcriptional regulator [Desulfobacteraceae bacterium]
MGCRCRLTKKQGGKNKMFAVSNKCRYGLTAVLTLAGHYDKGLLQIKEIAVRDAISRPFLEQIFNRLGRAGIVTSVRGKKGGYRLAVAPTHLPVLTILQVLGGEIEIQPQPPEPHDAVGWLFGEAEQHLKETFNISLDELLQKKQQLQEYFVYQI